MVLESLKSCKSRYIIHLENYLSQILPTDFFKEATIYKIYFNFHIRVMKQNNMVICISV